MITVKRYGRYYNVDYQEGELPKNALERAVALKKLGRAFSGPVEAKKHLPKVVKKPETKAKIKAKKKGK